MGIPRRDLPGDFGAWDTVYNRFRRWIASGSMIHLFEIPTAHPPLGAIRLLLDSTIVRARVHAAGVRKKKATRRRKGWDAAGAA